jgi:hypothetical protein
VFADIYQYDGTPEIDVDTVPVSFEIVKSNYRQRPVIEFTVKALFGCEYRVLDWRIPEPSNEVLDEF